MARQIIGMDGGSAPTRRNSVFDGIGDFFGLAPTPPPPPQLTFEAPVVNTQPAYQQPVYSQPTYSQPGFQTNGGGGAAPAPAPEPPPRPAPIDYTKYSDDSLAGVDSAFTDQRGMYQNALQKFLLDATRQEGDIKTDANTALGGVERNRTQGLTGLNEDYAARGLGRSGMRLGAIDEANQQFGRQKDAVTSGRDRGLADINTRREKMQSDTQNNIQAARREAYARLAAKQELV